MFPDLANFSITKNIFAFGDPTYSMIFSININDDTIFQKSINYSPDDCIEQSLKEMDFNIRCYLSMVNENQYYRDFLVNQALLKKIAIDKSDKYQPCDEFVRKIKKKVRKTPNIAITFRNIMKSIK